MAKGSSSELQKISLVGFVNDVYLLSKCYNEISDSFYSSSTYRLIYKTLKDYYNKYMKLPSMSEHIVMIDKEYTEDYGDKDDIINECKSIYEEKISSEDFIYENVLDFIRRSNIERELNNVVNYMANGKIDLEKVADNLRNCINLNLSKSPLYNLSDVTCLREVREESLGTDENPRMIKFFIDAVNKCMQYKAIIPGTLNMVVGPPGRGKTSLLINQGLAAAKQGYTSLHMFLGDMTKLDGLLRYLSCLSGVPTSTLVALSEEELRKFIIKWNMTGVISNLYVAPYAADQLTANQVIEEIMSMQRNFNVHFDQIIVDYDENIAYEADSTYMSGGQVYNKLALLSVLNRSVVWIAAQPKIEYWNEEILPLSSTSESSKKQKITDLMITLGKPSKSSDVGTLFIAKNRRGVDSKAIRLRVEGDLCRMSAITEDEYQSIKNRERANRNNNS